MPDTEATSPSIPADLKRYIDANEGALLEIATSLVEIDSQNPPGRTVQAITYLEDRFDDLGITTNRVSTDTEKPNLIATIEGETDTTIAFNGHVDTVPFERERWEFNPLGERVDDRLYGRGATDMKGAIASMLQMASAFIETDTIPPHSLQFVIVSDEETAGAAGLPSVLEGGHIEADACVIGEPTCEEGLHSVTVADKGSIWLTLEATGIAAHGSRPQYGENAIEHLLHAVDEIRKSLEAIEFNLDPVIEEIIDESAAFYSNRLDQSEARALFTKPTVNLGTIEGGETVNRVPDRASAQLDIRLTAGVHTPAILSTIRELIAPMDRVSIGEVSWSLGTYESIDAPIVSAVAQSAADVAGERIYRRSATGGGDAKQLREYGISTVEFAFSTDTAHAVDEYTTREILQRNAMTYATIPYAYPTADDP